MIDTQALRAEAHELQMTAKMYEEGNPSLQQLRELRREVEALHRKADRARDIVELRRQLATA